MNSENFGYFQFVRKFSCEYTLFIRAAMLGDNVCPTVFNILGSRPSIPIALDGPKAEIMAET